MSIWILVAVLGGVVGLDATSFPQFMVSRPVIAGTLTGAIFGRPVEGAILGFIMEAFSLITLPIGAARYPESGTATVAAVSAYLAVVEVGLEPGPLLLALVFALGWERLAGETVVLQRRSNGQILARHGGFAPIPLERRHLAAMTMDFFRGGVVAGSGGLIGYRLIDLVAAHWGLSASVTLGILTVVAATMIGTTLPLFGGARARRLAWGFGLGVGLLAAVVL